jgi:hypothetical protein
MGRTSPSTMGSRAYLAGPGFYLDPIELSWTPTHTLRSMETPPLIRLPLALGQVQAGFGRAKHAILGAQASTRGGSRPLVDTS